MRWQFVVDLLRSQFQRLGIDSLERSFVVHGCALCRVAASRLGLGIGPRQAWRSWESGGAIGALPSLDGWHSKGAAFCIGYPVCLTPHLLSRPCPPVRCTQQLLLLTCSQYTKESLGLDAECCNGVSVWKEGMQLKGDCMDSLGEKSGG